ncbi:thioredoxin [Sphingobacteriaceae bacterium]|nr:thioredoxin [Sphingobacteriaceae bacterium]
MKIFNSSLFFLVITFLLTSCGSQHTQPNFRELSPEEFESGLAKNPSLQLIDVRTPEEFERGHLEGAANYNIQTTDFEKEIESLDKNKPVYIYCLSGGRSASAASLLIKRGFSEVHNMTGGLMKWNASNRKLVEGKAVVKKTGMTVEMFKEFLKTDKFVLIDYNARWCLPCKKMAPMLDSLATSKSEKLTLVKIDADENSDLIKIKGIESLPVLELYKNGKMIWKHEGEIEEQELLDQIKL